jgi:hypothetical protein
MRESREVLVELLLVELRDGRLLLLLLSKCRPPVPQEDAEGLHAELPRGVGGRAGGYRRW